MSTARGLVESAFSRLVQRPGFAERQNQRQLALLLADCIQSGQTGCFEAPTGLGKSLAALIPAIACAIADQKRTVISTYTNVLAEQYWRKDLPLALSLFEGAEPPDCRFLIGRQRYACLAATVEHSPALAKRLKEEASMGIESEVRTLLNLPGREASRTWSTIAGPAVCPSRLCSYYDECFYYEARRAAERAGVVITNHSVVLQDAQMARISAGSLSMLGKVDFLIVDEAHDLTQAAANALEFEFNEAKLASMAALAGRMEQGVAPAAEWAGALKPWLDLCATFRQSIEETRADYLKIVGGLGRSGILAATPKAVFEHPNVRRSAMPHAVEPLRALAHRFAQAVFAFLEACRRLLDAWRTSGSLAAAQAGAATDAIRTYSLYLEDYALGCQSLFDLTEHEPGSDEEVAVTYAEVEPGQPLNVRRDLVDFSGPLQELLWQRTPAVCLSATLALDGSFDFFRAQTGVSPGFEDILPSPFDFMTQSALYMPPAGRIPDPSIARQQGTEAAYFDALAEELSAIVRAMGGRTLALFHSRREMEEVHRRIPPREETPVLMQRVYGTAGIGERFKESEHASLFALRSYWTGFDAPGPTLSCVVLVRVPFEVPVHPAQVARMAWLQCAGQEPFASYSLPNAKMMVRQGAGRLIRRDADVGVIALLDPRLRSKRYGEEIVANLPPMRTFDDFTEAMAWIGLDLRATT